MSGLIPALPLIIIRPFLPESPAWQQKKAAGTLRSGRASRELFSPELRRVTIVTTLMFACAYGAAFGAIQHMPRIVPATPEVATMTLARPMPADPAGAAAWRAEARAHEAAAGRGRAVVAGDRRPGRPHAPRDAVLVIVSRRGLLRLFQVPGLIVVPLVFWFAPDCRRRGTLKIGMFFAGLFTVAQFSFWGNYLPRVYPTHLRGTGEGFAANVGGRMLGTGFAFVTTTLASNLSGAPHVQLAMAATIVRRSSTLRCRAELLPARAEGSGPCRIRVVSVISNLARPSSWPSSPRSAITFGSSSASVIRRSTESFTAGRCCWRSGLVLGQHRAN